MPPPFVTLRKELARAIRSGHPWVFRDAIAPGPDLPDGAPVEVRTRDGRALATGYWDARSPIAVRILEAGPLADPRAAVVERIRAALQRRLDGLDRRRTNAFRWAHGEADRLPGLHVDLYDDVAVVRFDGDAPRAFYEEIGAVLAEAALPLVVRATIDRQTGETIAGRARPGPLVVRENGLSFEVTPGVGGKGGLFLDQRENRAEVEGLADGRRVLDLFAHTGAFSLYAMRGGARSTDTVDAAGPALEVAQANFRRNGFDSSEAEFHARDAFEFLEEAAALRRQWDLVVSDPPSFAPRKSAKRTAARAYTRLHRLAASVTAPGGILCAASCSSHVTRDEFLATLRDGARMAGRRVSLDRVLGAGFDHPVLRAFPEGDYLKFAIVTLHEA